MGKRLRFMTGLIAPLKVEPGNLKALLNQVHNLASANVTTWRSHTSYRERIGLRHFAFLPARGPLQRLDRPGLIEVDHRVELVRQSGPRSSGCGARFRAGRSRRSPAAADPSATRGQNAGGVEAEQELFLAHLVQQLFDAVRERGPHPLALGRSFPVAGCRHRAGVGREADETAVVGVPFADELAEVELAQRGGLRSPGVTEVGVVRPHHDLRGCAPAAGPGGWRARPGCRPCADRAGSMTRPAR